MKSNKKGFTIVELVIVVAIIAILAAVLIPMFSNVVKTAQTGADIQLVKNLNTVLATEGAIEGENATMYDALQDAKEAGYDVEKLTPTNADNDILWDQTCDRFVLHYVEDKYDVCGKNDDKPVPSGADIYKLWKIYETAPTDQTYSVCWNGAAEAVPATLTVGFDAGDVSGITNLAYTRGDSDAAQEVVIRTNGGTLTVNAPNDTVNHYGYAKVVNVESIGGASYHEFGNVKQIVVNDGHVVTERTAVILSISVEPTEGKQVSIDVTQKTTEVVVSDEFASRSADISIVGTTSVSTSAALVSALDEAKTYSPDATSVPSTFVIDKENNTITIKDEVALLYYGYVLDHEAALKKDGGTDNYTSFWYNDGRYNTPVRIILDCDIDFENVRFDKGMNADFGGEFDGQNHTIKNVVIEDGLYGAAGLFDYINYLNFKDLTLENISVTTNEKTNQKTPVKSYKTCAGILAGGASQLNEGYGIKNITIKNSSVTGAKYTGAVVGYAYADITDCAVIDCTVSGQYKMGGLVGYVCANNNIRKINQNTLTNVFITAHDVMEDKTPVVGKVVGNFNASGECKNNAFTNVTGSENNIGKIESGCTVTEN